MTIYLGTIKCVQDAYKRIVMIFLALMFLPSQASGQSVSKSAWRIRQSQFSSPQFI